VNIPSVRSGLAVLAMVFVGSVHCGAAEEATVLFDGKSLAQWDVIACEATVQDGAILLQAGNGLVQTKKRYGDVVFEFEWQALHPEKWDSGIYFRYTEVPPGRPWPKQYQVNLLKGREGELVGFKEGVNAVPVQAHEWTRFELTLQGKTASLKVNGQPAWKVDGIEQPAGYIALQAEVPGGGQFLFRNIRVRELSAH